MFESLNAMDIALFRLLNGHLTNPFLDDAMMLVTSRYTWIVVGVLFLAYACARWNRKLLHFAVLSGLTVGVVDFTAYQVLKPMFGRERPCRQFDDVHLVPQWCGGDYGFPSNHAANGMAVTVLAALTLENPAVTAAAFALTLLVGFSRIYVGVHFPGDVLGGYVVGALLGLACYWLYKRALALISRR